MHIDLIKSLNLHKEFDRRYGGRLCWRVFCKGFSREQGLNAAKYGWSTTPPSLPLNFIKF